MWHEVRVQTGRDMLTVRALMAFLIPVGWQFELLASYSDGGPKGSWRRTRTWSTLRACFATRTDERVISGRSPDWRGSRLQAREVSVVVASAGANKQGMVDRRAR